MALDPLYEGYKENDLSCGIKRYRGFLQLSVTIPFVLPEGRVFEQILAVITAIRKKSGDWEGERIGSIYWEEYTTGKVFAISPRNFPKR